MKRAEYTKKYRNENKEKCRLANKKWREENKEYDKQRQKTYWQAHPEKAAERASRWRKKNPQRAKEVGKKSYAKYINSHRERELWRKAKDRSEKKNIPFTIQIEDVIIPNVCPILGIKLEFGKNIPTGSSPSLDRVKPELGYTPDNIVVISHRANMLKSNGNAQEHLKIAKFLINFSH